MRLQVVKMRPGQVLQCCRCLRMSRDVFADLDGKPFIAYYCVACLSEMEKAGEVRL
jgi:hypothetical protein